MFLDNFMGKISGRIAYICLVLEAKFGDDPLYAIG